MSNRSPQETKPLDKPFKMSDDFKHLITYLPPLSAHKALDLKPQDLIQELEYAINTTRSFEQRAELQRLDDKRRFKPFLALLEQVVQNWHLKNFINQTLAFLPPDSEVVQALYAEEDGLKRDRKETKAVTLTSSSIQSFKLDDSLKDFLIASLWSTYNNDPTDNPTKDISTLESEISRYSPEQQIALKPLNKDEHLIPFLQKLKSISEEGSFAARISDTLLSRQPDAFSTFPTSPTTSGSTIKLPPLSNSGPDPDDGLYEYVEHGLHETPPDWFLPAYGDLDTPLQPTVGTNAAQQMPPGSPTADDKASNARYNIPGSVARRISFTLNIGPLTASSTNPSAPGKKSLEEEMPPLPTVNPTK